MSNKPAGVYNNAAGGDTAFRKTWNREEYAQKAREREAKEREERKARYEAKITGKKYIAKNEDAPLPDDAKMVEARRERINFDENIGKVMLVPAGASGGKRGKGAGYYCESCDLTYKNNLEWIEHLNSKQHMMNTGQTGEVERATLEDVRERLRWLKAKKAEQAKAEEFDLQKRLEERAKVEEQERLEKKERKKVKKEEAKQKKEQAEQQAMTSEMDVDANDDAAMMARMMGFGGFGTTKVK